MPTARDIAPQLPGGGISRRMRGSMPFPGPRDEEWDGMPVAVTDSGSMAGEDLRPYAPRYEDSEAATAEPPYWATWGFYEPQRAVSAAAGTALRARRGPARVRIHHGHADHGGIVAQLHVELA